MDSSTSMPRTVEEVFQDFRSRRSAICKALTTDVEEFYGQCDPAKENLCLYGHADEAWEVNLPAEEVPPELPEPTLGINFAREGMPRRDWLSLVAVHSDAWLLAVSSFYGACLDKKDRKRLFNMINDLPTVLEVVSGRKPGKEKTSSASNDGSKSKPGGKAAPKASDPLHGKTMPKPSNPPQPKEEEDDTEEEEDEEDEHGDTFCGSCGGSYGTDEFWIGCDECEKWYHGKCVKITPAKAEHIKHYKCPSCQSNKRARP